MATYYQPIQDWSRFEQLVKQKELSPSTATQLKDVLSMVEIVLLCDDSDSMAQPIAEEGTDPFAPKRSTRWLELKKLSATIIEFVIAINASGLDIYFLNREKRVGVNSMIGLQTAFSAQPNGGTPLIGTLRQVYNEKIDRVSKERKLLIIVVTDGEPTDGSRSDLYNTLVDITRSGNVHVSFAECTDNAEDMEYLDAWDGCIKNFDNTDDYREELQRVKMVQGMQFKFDYTDYVVKILLATFVRWYFNLDQVKVYDPRNNSSSVNTSYGSNYQSQPQYPSVQKLYTPPIQSYASLSQSQPSYNMPSTTPQAQQYTMPYTVPTGQPVQQYTGPSTLSQSQPPYSTVPMGQPVQQYSMPSTVPTGQPVQQYMTTTTTPVQQTTVVQNTNNVYYTNNTTTSSTSSTSSTTVQRSKSQGNLPNQDKKSSCQIS
jgi:hypothetical protein